MTLGHESLTSVTTIEADKLCGWAAIEEFGRNVRLRQYPNRE